MVLYELFGNKSYDEMVEAYESLEGENGLKADCLYLMTQLGNNGKHLESSSKNQLVMNEFKHASNLWNS